MPDWQSIAALACVAAATLYLAWQAFRRATKRTGCGGCGSCPASAPVKDSGLVSLDATLGAKATSHRNPQR